MRARLAALLLFAVVTLAQGVSVPALGCFEFAGQAWTIAGIAGNVVAQPALACDAIHNPWRIVEDEAGVWRELVDHASGAILERTRVEARHASEVGVFADGTLVRFAELELEAVESWQLVSADWMLVRTSAAWLLIPREAPKPLYLAPPHAGEEPAE